LTYRVGSDERATRLVNNSKFKNRRALLFCLFFVLAAIGFQLTTIGRAHAAGSVPNAPTSLSAVALSTSSVALQWIDNSSDESGFRIERCQGAGCSNFATLTTVGANVTSFTDGSLAGGTTYQYRVAAFARGRNSLSAYSNIAAATTFAAAGPPPTPTPSTVPAVPSNLVATASSSSQINLTWTDNSTNESGFKIYRCSYGCFDFGQIATVGSNVTSYQNTGLPASSLYNYWVSAYNSAGESGNSNSAQATTLSGSPTPTPTPPAGAPSAPVLNPAASITTSSATTTWSVSSGATGYRFYLAYDNAFTQWVPGYVDLNVGNVTVFLVTGLSPNTTFYCRVSAYNALDQRTSSNVISFTTLSTGGAPPPPTPTPTPIPTPPPSSNPWSNAFGSTTGDAGQAVAFDSSGNMYAAGYFQGTVDFGCGPLNSNGASYPDAFLAKYSSTGQCLWSKNFGGTLDDAGNGLAVDANDNVVVTGYFTGTANFGGGAVIGQRAYNIFVAKYAPDGTYQWARTFGTADGGGDNKAYAVAVGRDGSIAITGTFQGSMDFGGGTILATGAYDNIFVTLLSASGTHLWSKGFGSLDGADNFGKGIAVDASGNVVVTGYFQGTINFGGGSLVSPGGGDDIFVAKYSSTGGHLWSKNFGDLANQEALAAAVDTTGNIFITGMFKGTLNFGCGSISSNGTNYSDAFLVKLSSSGACQWSKLFTSPNPVVGRGVAVDSGGNVIVTGNFTGTVDFGGGPTASSGQNAFVAKYSSTGGYWWTYSFSSTSGFVIGYGAAADRNGNVGVTGDFLGTVNFGQSSLTSAGSLDAFVIRLAP